MDKYYTFMKTNDGLYFCGNLYEHLLLYNDYDNQECSIKHNIPTKLHFQHEIISIFTGSNIFMINTIDGLYIFGSGFYYLFDIHDGKLELEHEIIY